MRDIIRGKIVDALAAPIPDLTRRDVRLPGIPRKAVAVIGMRRTGKTTFLWQVLGDRLAKGTGREGLLYFNFEDERLFGMTAQDLQLVLEEYYRLHPEWRDRRRATFFFDEIQVVPGWERFARRILDTEQADLFLSGSSARLLSREVATSMRGRAMEARVFPFSFREYLRHRGAEPGKPPDRLPKAERSALEKHFREYLATGGFPEAQGATARGRTELLRGFVDAALLRDVIERHAASHPVALRWLAVHLLSNAAGLFSVNKFVNVLRSQGIAVAKDTLHEYLAHLEDAFLVRTVSIATQSLRRQMVNPRKVYPVDPGLIEVYDRSGRSNIGHRLETAVLLELERRGAEVTYVRTGEWEVDFLARGPAAEIALVQAAAELDQASTREREVRSLIGAKGEYPRASLELVTLTPETARGIPDAVTVHPAWRWFLSDAGAET